jgi:hypothetical protein
LVLPDCASEEIQEKRREKRGREKEEREKRERRGGRNARTYAAIAGHGCHKGPGLEIGEWMGRRTS